MTGTKYIGMDVHKESISMAVRSCRQDRDGMRYRDQSQHDPAVFRWVARRFARHL